MHYQSYTTPSIASLVLSFEAVCEMKEVAALFIGIM